MNQEMYKKAFEYGTLDLQVIDKIDMLLKKQKEDIVEMVYRIKYSSHNPDLDCECDICGITDYILKQLKQ